MKLALSRLQTGAPMGSGLRFGCENPTMRPMLGARFSLKIRTAITVWGALSLLATCALGADQPQWGQAWSRNLVSAETNLPDCFDPATGQNIRWRIPLGTETHATPVIANGRVLIGTNNEKPRDPRHVGDRSVLLCLDEKQGHLLWQLVVPKLTNSIYWDWPHAGICSPATVESNRVYLVSNRGEVLCLDLFGMTNGNDGPFRDEARHAVPAGTPPVEVTAADADILWAFDYIQQCGVRQHDQAHGSPLVYGRFLYVNTSNGVDDSHVKIASPDAPSLIVLDKATGQLVATDNEHIGPRIFHSTWSSPALAVVQGKPQIIFCGGDGVVYAFEPLAAGAAPPAKLKKVWQFDCDPTAPKEAVHRYNSNRKEGPSNIKSLPVFANNRLYVTVGGDLWWGKNEAWLKCIDATQTGDITRTGQLWSYPLKRHCMSTPAIHNGLVFVGDSGHCLHCVDAETGQPYWTEDVTGEIWASPLVADGKVYFATRTGEVLVFAESKQKQLLHRIKLDSPISGTPVAANGVLYITTMKQLYAVGR
jgi:outer membrane protein assembly factor BamB